jgi:hypothetical protein
MPSSKSEFGSGTAPGSSPATFCPGVVPNEKVTPVTVGVNPGAVRKTSGPPGPPGTKGLFVAFPAIVEFAFE